MEIGLSQIVRYLQTGSCQRRCRHRRCPPSFCAWINFVRVFFDLFSDLGFLSWTDSAANHAGGLAAHREKQLLEVVDRQLNAFAVDHQNLRLAPYLVLGVLGELVDQILELEHVLLLLDDEQLFVRLLYAGGNGNTDRGFDLVTREHPHLDACLPDVLQTRLDVFLKLVLHACYAQTVHVLLQFLDHLRLKHFG